MQVDTAPLADAIRDMISALHSEPLDTRTIHASYERLHIVIATRAGAGLAKEWEALDTSAKLWLRRLLEKVYQSWCWFHTHPEEAVELLNATLSIVSPKQNANEPRDRFIYNSMKKGKKLVWIRDVIEAKKTPGWEPILSAAGVSQAAMRYAKRNGLTWPLTPTR